MNRRTWLAGLLASPLLSWLGFKKVEASTSGDKPSPLENIEDGDRGLLLCYDFQYSESKRVQQPKSCRIIEFPSTMKLQTTYLKDGLEITWDWHCINPVFDGYPFNITRFIANPVMDDDGVMHSHSNVRAGNVPRRMYGPNKFLLSSIEISNPFSLLKLY